MLNCKSTDWCKSLLIVGSPGNNWREVRWQQTKFLLASVALKVKLFQIFAIMPNCPFMMSAISNRQFCDRFPGHVLLFGADCQILILFLRKGKLHSKQKTKQKYQSLKGFFTRGYFFCLKSEDSIGEHWEWAVPKAHTGIKLRVGAQTASISKKNMNFKNVYVLVCIVLTTRRTSCWHRIHIFLIQKYFFKVAASFQNDHLVT